MAWPTPIIALSLAFLWILPSTTAAFDTGLLEHPLNLNAELPQVDDAIGPSQAVAAARTHFATVRARKPGKDEPLEQYWRDYQTVLGRWKEPSTAKPVIITSEDGTPLIARFLVGLRKGNQVGGFVAVDPKDASIVSKLMWTPDLDPLWVVDLAIWEKAETVNDIEALEELVPPYSQFTSGIPIDPHDPAFNIVDGVVDVMPFKTQEERKAHVQWLNETYATSLRMPVKAKRGRRAATSKCMSVAASYVADWWTVQTGNTLPSYKNPAGGQKEYGYNPRLLEALFYAKSKKNKFFGKWTGDWRTAPFAHDLVTGEPISYSLRGYARLLAETGTGATPDPLIPSALTYETEDNHFHMDQKPHLLKIFTEGAFTGNSIRKDMKRLDDPDFPISVPPDYGSPVSADRIVKALDTWGVLLGQHMRRKLDGSPADSTFGTGVHAVQIVGWTKREGRTWLVYRETFGDASNRYLEDSFLGPSFRIMPIEYFYQAFAFPHHLYPDLSLKPGRGGELAGSLKVTTNHALEPIDPDLFEVLVDGKPSTRARIRKESERGSYNLRIPHRVIRNAARIEVRVAKRYFADQEGRNGFGIAVEKRDGGDWQVVNGPLEPVVIDLPKRH